MLKIMNAKLVDDPKGSDTEDQDMAQADSSTSSTPSITKKKGTLNWHSRYSGESLDKPDPKLFELFQVS